MTIIGDERRARQKAEKLLPYCASNAASRPRRAGHAIDALADLKWHRLVDVKAGFDENQVGAFALGGRVATGFCSPDWLSYAAIIPAVDGRKTHAVKHHHSRDGKMQVFNVFNDAVYAAKAAWHNENGRIRQVFQDAVEDNAERHRQALGTAQRQYGRHSRHQCRLTAKAPAAIPVRRATRIGGEIG
jgi:hypothetical protein